MATEIDIDDIVKGLEEVPDVFIRKSFEGVLRQAGNVFKKNWKDRLPNVTGNLKRSITTKVYPPEQGDPNYSVVVYAKRPKGSHAHLLEHGWKVGKRSPKGTRINRGEGVAVESGSPRVEGKNDFLKAKKEVTPKIENIISEAVIKELSKVFE